MTSSSNHVPSSNKKIEIGMHLDVARRIGGAHFFKVVFDSKVWSNKNNPEGVMVAQAAHPDNSEIWLLFENSTQYPLDVQSKFEVYVKMGKVVSINRKM